MFDVWLHSIYKGELTAIFIKLGDSPVEITPDQMNVMERYIMELYGSRDTSLASDRLDKLKNQMIMICAPCHPVNIISFNMSFEPVISLDTCGDSLLKN